MEVLLLQEERDTLCERKRGIFLNKIEMDSWGSLLLGLSTLLFPQYIYDGENTKKVDISVNMSYEVNEKEMTQQKKRQTHRNYVMI